MILCLLQMGHKNDYEGQFKVLEVLKGQTNKRLGL